MARIQLATANPEAAVAASDEANLSRALEGVKAAERENERKERYHREPTNYESTSLSIKETVHTKNGYPIWIVQLADRVDRKEFTRLMKLARMASGYWSSFGPVEIHGFIFKEEAKAKAFVTLASPSRITSGSNNEHIKA